MQAIDLLQPAADDDEFYDNLGFYIPVHTMAIPVSGSRVIKSDSGVEIEEGSQKFIISKRIIDTSWKVNWNGINFRVEGISPSSSPYKLVLTCSVEERDIALLTVLDWALEDIHVLDWGDDDTISLNWFE